MINCKNFTCKGQALSLTVYQCLSFTNFVVIQNLTIVIYFIISYILNDTVHISDPLCDIFKTFCLIVINYFILTELFFCGFGINRILPLKNSCTHLQADNRVLVMPRHTKKGLRYARSSGDETLLGHLWPTDYIHVHVKSQNETSTIFCLNIILNGNACFF